MLEGLKLKAGALLAAVLIAAFLFTGCDQDPDETAGAQKSIRRAKGTAEALRTAFDQLKDEQFEPDQALAQSGSRFNQWLISQPSDPTWRVDTLVKTLPEEFREGVEKKPYDDLRFHPQLDGEYLRQCIWLNDISQTQLTGQPSDLELAQRLFDWTVRNIQLEVADRPAPEVPWKVLLRGRGTALERTWVFILLARQQGLDVVLLATGDGDQLEPWLPALLHEGQLYLFDAQLGLAIPGPEGQGAATLEQARSDDGLLRQLDLEGKPYPISSEDLAQLTVLLEGSPFALSRRMQLVESQLSSEQRVVLTTDPSAVAKRLRDAGLTDIRLWQAPFNALIADVELLKTGQRTTDYTVFRLLHPGALRQARLLHFRGNYSGEDGAKAYYMESRRSEQEIEDAAVAMQLDARQIQAISDVKQDASYWLGLVTFEEGDYKAAIDHLQKRTLEAWPDGPWSSGARYNLARAYEATGNVDDAIKIYQAKGSPQEHGNQLRAEWLKDGKLKPPVDDQRAS